MTLTYIKEKGERVTGEVRVRMAGYITAGLGLVAGLAWNDAIKTLIEYFFPLKSNGVLAKFGYAALVTVAVVIVTVVLLQRVEKDNTDKK